MDTFIDIKTLYYSYESFLKTKEIVSPSFFFYGYCLQSKYKRFVSEDLTILKVNQILFYLSSKDTGFLVGNFIVVIRFVFDVSKE